MKPFKRMILINESDYKKPIQLPTTIPIDQLQKLHAHNLEAEIREAAATEEPAPTKQLPISLVKLSINKFPIYARTRANAILDELLSNHISWDGEGQVKLSDGQLITNSNIIDLIYYAAADKSRGKMTPPIGYDKLDLKAKVVVKRRVVAPENVPLPPSPVKRAAETPAKRQKKRAMIGEDYMLT